jgi:hypothetical protein
LEGLLDLAKAARWSIVRRSFAAEPERQSREASGQENESKCGKPRQIGHGFLLTLEMESYTV